MHFMEAHLYKVLGNEENHRHWTKDLQGKRMNSMPFLLSTWHWFIHLLSGLISFPHTDFIPWPLVRRQLKTLLCPGNLWVKAPRTPREAVTWTPNVLCFFFDVPSFLYGQVNQTLKPPNQPVFRWVISLFFSTGQLQCSNSHCMSHSKKKIQSEVQADRLVRKKRNNVLKSSEITDNFCPFGCLSFIFVTCYSGPPAQRKTAPCAQRCKSTGAKLHFLLVDKITKSSTILTVSAFGKTLMASLQGCYVHKHRRQRDNLPVMWQTLPFSLVLWGLVTVKQSLRSDRAQPCTERSWRLTYCPSPSLPPAVWVATLHFIR